ncbi:murein biosynthesis integral membrane protein MurJ [Candidatus Rhabdochlamydia sp. W815]|uniref:murein biosynthesis integral membrane protein MurJ n=1 Tax=Candidatus Rhabdochlamydia sp. W815 TaxID=2720721 RepID=UPI001BFC72C0|nr:murein biosynthesis integral membrane protein MurJ [Candidatus Rhabdochlamydia sp. W815]KAG6558873.1 putative lipid II flippase MurJ [Candidatus Rhabdochlamydia sp. W815]
MEEKSLRLTIKRFFSGTLLSRMSGMGRDLVMAFAFGDHASVAAFMVAFRLSNLLRRLLGEGPFQSAFIPHFMQIHVQDKSRANRFFCKLSLLLSLLLIGFILLAEGGITAFLTLPISDANREILKLTAWLLPGLLFICMYGLNISVLNCYEYFFIPSFAPFICNMIWMLAAFLLRHQAPDLAMPYLAKWVAIGFFGQWLITFVPTLRCVGGNWRQWFDLQIPEEVQTLAKTLSLSIIGVGAMQINSFVDPLFARYIDVKAPTYLWYSIRLEQLALAIFGIACVSTIVPRLARCLKNGQIEQAKNLFSFSYQRIMMVMIPCTFAILAIGTSSVNLLYGRGNFSEIAVVKTTFCLWAYSLGLVPSSLVLLFSAIFYAQNHFRTPMFLSVATVAVNIVLNTLFVFQLQLGVISTALATSISAYLNYWILYKFSHKAGWKSPLFLPLIFKTVFASAFAALCAFGIGFLLNSSLGLTRHVSSQLLSFFTQAFAFILGLFFYAKICKHKELLDLFSDFFLKTSPEIK